jgi:hypothetical protein
MTRSVIVAGVGMIPFVKPGASETCDVMAASADSTAGQRALYGVGMTRIPDVNVRAA